MRDIPRSTLPEGSDAEAMHALGGYRLWDVGEGRRLEQFGELRLDRPAVGTEGLPRRAAQLWSTADARYDGSAGGQGQWQPAGITERETHVTWQGLAFTVRPTAFGHVGLFPEQLPNWVWIREQVGRSARPRKVLNLFAYTGAGTLAAAAAGAEVTHVDAARSAVAWAQRNAAASGLEKAPIRWLVDDAVKFVARELRRGKGYDAVILDPPSYGHGPRGERWQLGQQLPELLAACAQLTVGRRAFVLLTAHSPGYGAEELAHALAHACRDTAGRTEGLELAVSMAQGCSWSLGAAARWTCTG